jgi:hypothetical protein
MDPEELGFGGREWELIGALIVVVAVRPLMTELRQTSLPSGSTLERLPGEHCDRPPLASSDVIVKDLYISVPLPSEQSPRSRDRGGGMNGPDTLRAAARALSDRTDLVHAPALAGLLQNRADDMERNIAIWRRAGQDVPALVDKYYGVYLTVALAVSPDPRHGLDCTAPSPKRTKT